MCSSYDISVKIGAYHLWIRKCGAKRHHLIRGGPRTLGKATDWFLVPAPVSQCHSPAANPLGSQVLSGVQLDHTLLFHLYLFFPLSNHSFLSCIKSTQVHSVPHCGMHTEL